ncbi:MAG: hypothetical protein WAO98_06575 [Alphaproteobacteria bacterium]
MGDMDLTPTSLEFNELESRFGRDNAISILRTLEQFEGIVEARVTRLSNEDRLKNVFRLMRENMRYQTRH